MHLWNINVIVITMYNAKAAPNLSLFFHPDPEISFTDDKTAQDINRQSKSRIFIHSKKIIYSISSFCVSMMAATVHANVDLLSSCPERRVWGRGMIDQGDEIRFLWPTLTLKSCHLSARSEQTQSRTVAGHIDSAQG